MSGYLEFGEVKSDSNDRFLSCTPEAYDEATKPLSGDHIHIIRIPKMQLLWLAEQVCRSLDEAEFDDLMFRLEEGVVQEEEKAVPST